jgi:hypothetical protein
MSDSACRPGLNPLLVLPEAMPAILALTCCCDLSRSHSFRADHDMICPKVCLVRHMEIRSEL